MTLGYDEAGAVPLQMPEVSFAFGKPMATEGCQTHTTQLFGKVSILYSHF